MRYWKMWKQVLVFAHYLLDQVLLRLLRVWYPISNRGRYSFSPWGRTSTVQGFHSGGRCTSSKTRVRKVTEPFHCCHGPRSYEQVIPYWIVLLVL
ncbi:hypothetical protein BDR03DRAFT_974097 [Suillus americanus]|nr:hypothetical protein BDR03DRAFT_974097 [Suillus americanus]